MRRLWTLALVALLCACSTPAVVVPEPAPAPSVVDAVGSPEPVIYPEDDGEDARPPAPDPILAPGQILSGESPSPPPAPKPEAVTTVPILMYHYIRDVPVNSPDKLGYGLSVAPKLFDQQLSWLASNGYSSISMGQLADHIAGGAALPPKPVVLTFDDGYSDFYTAALPILQRYHFTATAYLVVDFLGKPGYLSWQQAQALEQASMEVGDHTLDHVDLAIQLLPQAQRQIGDSRTMLQQRLGVPISTFAYPSGRYNDSVVKIVGSNGFRSAVTTDPGDRYTPAKLLTLPRVRVSGGESAAALAKSLA
ncbi:MAG: polysaccharide deacetylase family protein [Chloroflexi bacterium]|nr:polysaccharide deacetylase family protein [Chloroflexota bacterium]